MVDMRRPPCLVLSALLGLVACSAKPKPRVDVEVRNVGGLCSPAKSFDAGEPIEFVVKLENCAAPCASEVTTGCRVKLEGTTLEVEASASYTVPGEDQDCAAICHAVRATCTSDPLPAGSYTLRYGQQTTSFEVPSAGTRIEIAKGCVDFP